MSKTWLCLNLALAHSKDGLVCLRHFRFDDLQQVKYSSGIDLFIHLNAKVGGGLKWWLLFLALPS